MASYSQSNPWRLEKQSQNPSPSKNKLPFSNTTGKSTAAKTFANPKPNGGGGAWPSSNAQSVLNSAVPKIDDGAGNRYDPMTNSITNSAGKVQTYVPLSNMPKPKPNNNTNTGWKPPVGPRPPITPNEGDPSNPPQPPGSDIGTADPTNPYPSNTYESYLFDMFEAQRKEQEARIQAQIESLNSNRDVYRQQAENSARQSYVQKMMSMKELPEVMSTTGMSGSGLAESSMIGVNNNYENAVNQSMSARDDALRGIDNQIAQVRLGGEANMSAVEAAYAQQLNNARIAQSQMDYQSFVDTRNYDFNAKQSQWDNNYRDNIFNHGVSQDKINNDLAWKKYYGDRVDADFQKDLASRELEVRKHNNTSQMVDSWLKKMVQSGEYTEHQALLIAQKYGLY